MKRAIQQITVSRRREEVRDDCREQEDRPRDKTAVVIIFHTFCDGEESQSVTDLESLDEQDVWCATDDNAEYEAKIELREATKKLQRETKSTRFCKRGDDGR